MLNHSSTIRGFPSIDTRSAGSYLENLGNQHAPYSPVTAGKTTSRTEPKSSAGSYLENIGNQHAPYSPTTTGPTPSGTEPKSPYMIGIGGGTPSVAQPKYAGEGVPTNKQPSNATPKPGYMGNW